MLVCVYAFVLSSFIIDVPSADDLIALLPLAVDWKEPHTLGERLEMLFAQHFSHRIALTRVIAAASIWAFGYLDLAFLQGVNIAAWCGLTLSIVSIARNRAPKDAWVIVIPFLLLNPLGQSNVLVAMNGLSNITILLIALASVIVCTSEGRASFLIACLLGVIAIFTNANGVLILPLLAASYFFRHQGTRGLLALLLACLSVSLYFVGYSRTISASPGASFYTDSAYANLELIASNTLTMLGAPFGFGRLQFHAIGAIGFFILATALAFAFLQRRRLLQLPEGLFLVFLLGSTLMTAIGRIGWGTEYVMSQDRYSPYGLLVVALLWIFLLQTRKQIRTPVLAVALIASVGLCFSSYARMYAPMLGNYRWNQAVAINSQLGVQFVNNTHGRNGEEQRRAVDTGAIRLPRGFPDAPPVDFLQEVVRQQAEPDVKAKFATSSPGPGYTKIEVKPEPGVVWTPFALLINSAGKKLLPIAPERAKFVEMIGWGGLVNKNRIVFVYPAEVAPADISYLYGIEPLESGGWNIAWSAVLQ